MTSINENKEANTTMENNNVTESKEEYIKQWREHVDACARLTFTPSKELSDEVKGAVLRLHLLVQKVADDKWASKAKHAQVIA